MRKTLLMAAIACLAITSCKKARTCTCTTAATDSNGTAVTGSPVVIQYKKISKKDAKNNCISVTSTNTGTYGGSTSTYKTDKNCTLS
ncbi:MAG: hypothetical protein JWO32_1267 [Bacteroidetes bacterium]|nr:hypothetical protein [Bacteroidota bacterium]